MGIEAVEFQPFEHDSQKDQSIGSTPSTIGDRERDLHQPPAFDSESFANPTSATLYLPPLLCSLATVTGTGHPLVTRTHLPDIDPVSLSLHEALHYFRPLSSEYASLRHAGAFNCEWYAVAFWSERKAGSDSDALHGVERPAHEEAISNGGVHTDQQYSVPEPQTGLSLATCIWQSRRQGLVATSRPHHTRAMNLAAASYEVYNLERYRLFKANIQVEKFGVDVEVGW
ncbi:hypothetical protein EV401DRAFT_2088064 [Pisolithus croceorrhizus]|nr:hypothetical protein EV401DRAFT_2088064 [Pisolithus croceorrhizus]